MMFFNRHERKRHSVMATLTVGALATVGAITVFRCGKDALCNAKDKIKSFFSKNVEIITTEG